MYFWPNGILLDCLFMVPKLCWDLALPCFVAVLIITRSATMFRVLKQHPIHVQIYWEIYLNHQGLTM